MTEIIDMTDLELDEAPLPPRPRRRAITPAGAICGAVLIAALGFLGGVQVQKSSGSSSSALPGAGGFQRAGGAGGGQQQQQSDATVGQVSSVDGKSFYVIDQSGATVKVTTNQQSKVTRSAKAKPSAIHPGDTVIVQGRTANSGTVVASTVVATASNAGSALSLFGGGGFAQQGAAPGGG
jgi:Domain of unknown function (DUF5666)